MRCFHVSILFDAVDIVYDHIYAYVSVQRLGISFVCYFAYLWASQRTIDALNSVCLTHPCFVAQFDVNV